MALMLLGEELILLLLADDSGEWLVRRRAVHRALRVALVTELLARRTVFLDDDGMLVTGLPATSGGDPVLDRVARQVVGGTVSQAVGPGRRDLGELVHRLRSKGVLRRGRIRPHRHLPRDHHPEAGVRDRLLKALDTPLRPERHTALLVALVHELNLLPQLFPDRDTLPLSVRAAAITAQLREDAHYFPTGLGEDSAARPPSDVGDTAADVLGGIGDALEALSVMVDVLRLLSLPARAVIRVLDGLP